MKVSRLEQAIASLIGNGKLTPALETLGSSGQLRGPELDEFGAAAETLAERVRKGGNKAARSENLVRPWV